MAKRRRAVQMSPQFFKILLSPHASKLHIPDEFVMTYGADLRDLVFLEVPSGAIWEVKLQNSNGMKWLEEGWNQFKEYYSIGCGYFLLFQYNGNSHFSVFIFDLSASEIEYPSGPSEDITPENFVNIAGDASHRKKAGGPETQNNVRDDDLLRDKTANVTEIEYPSGPSEDITPENFVNIVGDASHRKKAGGPETQNNVRDEDLLGDKTANVIEIEYPSGPSEDITPENFVNIVGDASHRKKAGGPETQNNVRDDDLLRDKTANVTEIEYPSGPSEDITPENFVNIVGDASHRKKAGGPETQNNVRDEDLLGDKTANVIEIEYPSGPSEDITPENFVNIVGDASLRKKAGGPETQNNVCDDDLLGDKTAKVTKVADRSYSEREKSGIPASRPSCLPERPELNRVKIAKPDMEEEFNYATPKDKRKEINEKLIEQNIADIGNGHCNEVLDPSASKMINTSKCNKRKYSIRLEASCCRYPLRSEQLQLEQSKENGSPSYSRKPRPAAPLSCPGTRSEKKEFTGVELEKANSEEDFCFTTPKAKRAEANLEKLVEQDRHHNFGEAYKFKGHCNEVPVVDPLACKVTITNERSKKKTATSLDASNCRYPLRNKQLQELKIEKGDVEGQRNKIPVVDPSATKMTTTYRHHEKKTGVSLDTPNCRYPLRSMQSKQLKEVKLENSNAEEDLLYVAKKEKRKKASNVKLEKGDVEECNNDIPIVDPSTTKKTTNRHYEEKIGISLHTSQCRYPLRSKRPDEVKLETADMEGSLNSAAYKGKDSTASEMTNTWQEKDVTLREAQLGKLPHFIVSMKPSYVSRNFQLDIPVNFFKKYIKEEETIVNLRLSDGRTWPAKFFIQSNCAKIQPSDWREFVLGNSLKVHDTCLFELSDGIEPVLNVTIFRATAPL